ncbi:fatty acid desaturase [Candidatus Woesearchaeota archaeon]|nr:fatty acid desaturase [Candidatus Woesearchaeota archaeon]
MDLKNIEWKATLFVCTYHLILLVFLPFYFINNTPSWGIVMSAIILMVLTGLSITAGYHRFYSHKSYSVNKVVEFFLLFFATMSFMGSVFEWASKHRLHHRFVDKDQDPYTVNKGFFHAHIFWFFQKSGPLDKSTIPDLINNKLLKFQHKHASFLSFLVNIMAFLFVGYIFNDYVGALALAIGLRIFLVHHFTWFINSAAHYWGERTYSKELTAVDNFFLAIFTFGEGYHNYHHVFASDYRNGVRWYHYDPTKWLIWTLSKLGLASDLVTIDSYISKKRLVSEDRRVFLNALQDVTSLNKQALQDKVKKISDKLDEKIINLKRLVNEYKETKKKISRIKSRQLKSRIKQTKSVVREEWNDWLKLGKEISKLAPLHTYH